MKKVKGYAVLWSDVDSKEPYIRFTSTEDGAIGIDRKIKLKRCRKYVIEMATKLLCDNAKGVDLQKAQCYIIPINISFGKIQLKFSGTKVKKIIHKTTHYIEEYLYK